MNLSKLLFSTFVLFFLLGSCSSDDDEMHNNGNNFEALIVGEWQLQSGTFNGNPENFDDCDLMSTISFSENSSFLLIEFAQAQPPECSSFEFQGAYIIAGTSLELDYENNVEETYTINTLNETNLITTITFEDQGETSSVTTTYSRRQ